MCAHVSSNKECAGAYSHVPQLHYASLNQLPSRTDYMELKEGDRQLMFEVCTRFFKRFPDFSYTREIFRRESASDQKRISRGQIWNQQTWLACVYSSRSLIIIYHRLPSDPYLILAADWLRLVPVLDGYALLPWTFLLGFPSGRYQSAASKNFR